jgi:hypothetical protein
VKTFGRFSSHRRFEYRKNISALVIFLSLAVFDHITNPKDLPRVPNLMRETDEI